jgi:hypothetical protein
VCLVKGEKRMQKLPAWDHGMTRWCCAWLMLLAVILTVGLPQTASAEPLAAVDSALVGVWEQMVPNPLGVARWEIGIGSDGTFTFRSEGPGAALNYVGTFKAIDGRWTLSAPMINWNDEGAYELPTPDTFVMQGKLGTGTWKKIRNTAKGLSQNTQPSPKTIVPEGPSTGAASAVAEVEPCSLLTLAEVSEVLNAPASMDRPHRVRRNNVTVGGDCVYRSAYDRTTLVTLHVDAYPGGHQRTALARRCQRPYTVDVSGVGDAACAEDPPAGPKSLTFLRGEVLVMITMTDPLGIAEAKELARRAIARLPISAR